MSGVVFHHISEGILAQNLMLDVKESRDSTSILLPDVKDGNLTAANYVLNYLGFVPNNNWSGSYVDGNPVWGKAAQNGNKEISLSQQSQQSLGTIPDVVGMGARDAVYQIERRGVRVRLRGRGRVTKQSLEPGHQIKKGDICELLLEV
jgi:cell division protein FtsI (penicillin-binding protein 3)